MAPRASQPTRKKILIWSGGDKPQARLADWLQAAGYETVVYPDVHDVVAVCAAEAPNLMVVSGCESASGLLESLDGNPRTNRTPVLLLYDGCDPPPSADTANGWHVDWMAGPPEERGFLLKVKAMLRVAYAESIATTPRERDSLTKLYNRRYFDERLDKEIERARRYGRKLSCVMLDVDGLQKVNELHGHQTGDGVLRALADILLSCTRCSDIIARYGGEEFALLLPETVGSDAGVLAERLRKAFAERGLGELNTTVSCGVATYPDHARDAATLVRMADSAVFQAKGDGGNRTVVAFSDQGDSSLAPVTAGPTILLVEDNDYNRSMASLVLRASGYEVLEAEDGATALSLAKSERPDLVIVDIQLSGAGGLDATRRLVEMAEMKNTPIVALTARDVPGDLEALVKAGCRGYIVKPIDTNSLASQIQSYLKS
jgi:diguanylate cyclase (GGDEF)-like protein